MEEEGREAHIGKDSRSAVKVWARGGTQDISLVPDAMLPEYPSSSRNEGNTYLAVVTTHARASATYALRVPHYIFIFAARARLFVNGGCEHHYTARLSRGYNLPVSLFVFLFSSCAASMGVEWYKIDVIDVCRLRRISVYPFAYSLVQRGMRRDLLMRRGKVC